MRNGVFRSPRFQIFAIWQGWFDDVFDVVDDSVFDNGVFDDDGDDDDDEDHNCGVDIDLDDVDLVDLDDGVDNFDDDDGRSGRAVCLLP